MGFRAGQIVISGADRATAEPCQDFWDTLRTTFSDKTMHLVLDNATVHHAQVLQPYFLDHLVLPLT